MRFFGFFVGVKIFGGMGRGAKDGTGTNVWGVKNGNRERRNRFRRINHDSSTEDGSETVELIAHKVGQDREQERQEKGWL